MKLSSQVLVFFAFVLAVRCQNLLLNVGGPDLPVANFARDPTANLLSSASASVALPSNTVPLNSSWGPIYSTYRYAFGGNIAYRFNVSKGNYSVAMAFAETYLPAFFVGARQFDVVINEVVYFKRLDVFATVGANSPLYLRVDDIAIADGQLTIVMQRVEGRQNPLLSALVIKPSVV
ncbi:hypothetical protein BWQ96_07786 [Gracilariopsis chorda]|uniref:Malectin domain-containing protein n=1 Tax=Gracilariopsis chorda TaxID=448386 RepID=A0A2V3IK79_9FLOR|nr:hypothetical protein BWQ96_07786 [Gracilariopsis chorda]|eukprot:PXF42477.1 hypothetical protein BWQ96_07786 [Gracilariopsis chorda]